MTRCADRRLRGLLVAAAAAAVIGALCAGVAWQRRQRAMQAAAEEARRQARIDRGRNLFLHGVGGTGALRAHLGADRIELTGELVACARCHGERAAGTAGAEPIPPIHARALFTPVAEGDPLRPARPPYDPSSLRAAITQGHAPGGRALSWLMPRFVLTPSDVEDLAAYLAVVEDERDPGVLADRLVVGTRLPPAGPLRAAAEDAVAVLRAAFAEVNARGGLFGRRLELKVESGAASDAVFARVASVYPEAPAEVVVPELAPVGLEPRDAAAPVFLLRAGVGDQARWAVQQRLAEGDTLAIVHGGEDPARRWARAAADEAVRAGHPAPPTREVTADCPAACLLRWVRSTGARRVLYAGPAATLAELAAGLPRGVELDAPAGLARAALGAAAARVQFVYPGEGGSQAAVPPELAAFLQRHRLAPGALAFQANALAGARLLVAALERSGAQPTRAGLVAALESVQDLETGVTPPLTYAPGQRVGLPGARWVRMDATTGALVPVSSWIALAP